MAGRKTLVSEKVYAEISGFELGKIRNDRWKKKGLPYFKIGRAVRYDLDEIHEMIQRCRIETRQGGAA